MSNTKYTYPSFYQYLIDYTGVTPGIAKRYVQRAGEALDAVGLSFTNATLLLIDGALREFAPGGRLEKMEEDTHYYRTSLRKLREYLSHVAKGPTPTTPTKPSPTVKGQPIRKGSYYEDNSLQPLPFLGDDYDCGLVHYADGIPQGKRVPGLAEYLNKRYPAIRDFLVNIFKEYLREPLEENWERSCIPVILKKNRPCKSYPFDSRAWALRQWELSGHNLTAQEIIDILKQTSKESRVLGKYIHGDSPWESHIEIYYNNVYMTDIDEYFTLLEGVLAHEYTHFLHHVYLGRSFVAHTSLATIIKESVADFASYLYLIDRAYDRANAAKVASDKLSGWIENFGSGWPYAEAYWFFYINGVFLSDLKGGNNYDLAKGKLFEVFGCTIFEFALEVLHS